MAEIVRQASYALAAAQQELLLSRDPQRRSEAWPAVPVIPHRDGHHQQAVVARQSRGSRRQIPLAPFPRRSTADRADGQRHLGAPGQEGQGFADHFEERIDDLVRDQRILRRSAAQGCSSRCGEGALAAQTASSGRRSRIKCAATRGCGRASRIAWDARRSTCQNYCGCAVCARNRSSCSRSSGVSTSPKSSASKT